MKKMTTLLVGLGMAACMATQASATVTTFTDRTAWENALAGATFMTEDFNGPASDFGPNSSGGSIGMVTTLDVIGHVNDDPPSSPQGLNGTGLLLGEIDSSGEDIARLQFNTPLILGFAIVGLTGEDGLTVALTEIGFAVDGESFLASDVTGDTDSPNATEEIPNLFGTAAFLGFVTMNPVTSFQLIHGDLVAPFEVAGNNESFAFDELILAKSSTQPVPEPSTMILLGTGLAGIIAWRRKQKV